MAKQKKFSLWGIGFLFSILSFLLFSNNNIYAQFPPVGYPFHAISDGNDNIYITGMAYNSANSTNDIFIAKIDGFGNLTSEFLENIDGLDKGMSIALDHESNILITGFYYNSNTSTNDIIIAKYNSSLDSQWAVVIPNDAGDDAGLSIKELSEDNIAICGYYTNPGNVDCYLYVVDNSGNYEFDGAYDSPDKLTDVGTSLIADDYYIYVAGYTDQGSTYGYDLLLVDFDISTGSKVGNEFIYNSIANEYPTGHIITDFSQNPILKSKRSLSVHQEYSGGNNNFFTCYIDGNNLSNNWYDTLDYSTNDVLTSVICDNEFIYSAGYTHRGRSEYDFAILKYEANGNMVSGFPLWYDHLALKGDDKPSSLLISNDLLYITGYSSSIVNEYVAVGFNVGIVDSWENAEPVWVGRYIPNLGNNNLGQMKKYTYCAADKNGNITMIAFGYNDSNSFIAGQKYNREGKVLHSIQPEIIRTKRIIPGIIGEETTVTNYPNPFNPVSNISFTLPAQQFVELAIYDISGRQIESLIKQYLNAGNHIVKWDASKYSSGIYFYRLKTENQIITKKLVLVK
ncbi:MAG TPA: T9SS type A sorting domain-containing protein [Ignavibacteria bacterium]|nr:T9SS type A sorting domain-containing protein [Ignavibacteria bacterium]